jgi:hypothetical protein
MIVPHSPAPWTYHKRLDQIRDKDGELVAAILSNREDNGKILAAAPTMLRVLKDLVDAHYSDHPMIDKFREDARVVIAEAETLPPS